MYKLIWQREDERGRKKGLAVECVLSDVLGLHRGEDCHTEVSMASPVCWDGMYNATNSSFRQNCWPPTNLKCELNCVTFVRYDVRNEHLNALTALRVYCG